MLRSIYWATASVICIAYSIAVYKGVGIPFPKSIGEGRGSTGYFGGWGGGK